MKAVLLLALFAIPSMGQVSLPCDLTIDKSPSIRGLRLQMPEADVLKLRLFTSKVRPDGRRLFMADVARQPEFTSLHYVAITTYQQYVSSFAVMYKEDTNDFEPALSEIFPISPAGWRTKGSSSSLECVGFRFEIDRQARRVYLYDTLAEKNIAAEKTKGKGGGR